MPKILFVVGLPGSGKTGYLQQLALRGFQQFDDFKANAIGDSSAFTQSRQFEALMRALQNGRNCAVADIDFCRCEAREDAKDAILKTPSAVEFDWHCFEPAVEQCRANIRERARSSQERDLRKLDELVSKYTLPRDATRLKVWRTTGGEGISVMGH